MNGSITFWVSHHDVWGQNTNMLAGWPNHLSDNIHKVNWKLLKVVQFIAITNCCIQISTGEIEVLFWKLQSKTPHALACAGGNITICQTASVSVFTLNNTPFLEQREGLRTMRYQSAALPLDGAWKRKQCLKNLVSGQQTKWAFVVYNVDFSPGFLSLY